MSAELLQRHRGMVHRVVRRYRWALGASLDYDDLMQAGMMGVLRAAQTYDATLGVKETTYFYPWVRHYVQREVEVHGSTIRAPRMQKSHPTVSADCPMGDETLLDTLAAPSGTVARMIDAPTLSAMERETLRLHLQGYTHPEIGMMQGVTASAVSLRIPRAVAKIRKWLRSQKSAEIDIEHGAATTKPSGTTRAPHGL